MDSSQAQPMAASSTDFRLFVRTRWTFYKPKIQLMLSLVLLGMAVSCAFSQHWSMVLAGALLGLLLAMCCLILQQNPARSLEWLEKLLKH